MEKYKKMTKKITKTLTKMKKKEDIKMKTNSKYL